MGTFEILLKILSVIIVLSLIFTLVRNVISLIKT